MLSWRTSWARYAFAVGITAAVSLLYLVNGPAGVDSDIRYFGFTFAVLLSAIVGGLGAGILSTGLAAIISAYLLLPPIFSIQIASAERTAHLILFVGEGVLVSFIGNLIRDACTEDLEVPGMRRYWTAAVLVAAATAFKLLAWREVERDMPFALYYAAIVASAWFGGLGAGLLATLLATLCARCFFIEPVYSLAVHSPVEAARVFVFVTEGIILSILAGKQVTLRGFANQALDQMRLYGKRLWKGAEDARALRAISRDVVWEWDLPSNATIAEHVTEESVPESNGNGFSTWLRRVHPKDRLKVLASLKTAFEEGRPEWFYEYRRLFPGKGYVRVADHAFIIRDNAWNPVRVVGRSADLSDVQRSVHPGEDAGTYRALFENNPHAMLLADRDLHILEANDAACDVLEYSRDALTHLALGDLLPGSAEGRLLTLTLEDPSSLAFENNCVRASGDVFRAKISAAMLSGVERNTADRIITIEEMSDADADF